MFLSVGQGRCVVDGAQKIVNNMPFAPSVRKVGHVTTCACSSQIKSGSIF